MTDPASHTFSTGILGRITVRTKVFLLISLFAGILAFLAGARFPAVIERKTFEAEAHHANEITTLMAKGLVGPLQRNDLTEARELLGRLEVGSAVVYIYKKVLLLAWADGALSKEDKGQLLALRTSLNITPEIHTRLEQDVKRESYAHAFQMTWTSGLNAKERGTVVAELRKKFTIGPTEHAKIESKVQAELGPEHHQQTIVIIDDEDAMRLLISQVLEESGFVVQSFATSDEAIVALKDLTPDLILSDINLDTSTMGSFSFYEKVRLYQHLSMVPFMFLSGLRDEGMIRYGKGLGADDYFTKPFSNDLLLDTVRGKIKHYRQMRPLPAATS